MSDRVPVPIINRLSSLKLKVAMHSAQRMQLQHARGHATMRNCVHQLMSHLTYLQAQVVQDVKE